MNFKKMIGLVSAAAIASSAFVSMAVTASAADTALSYGDLATAGYTYTAENTARSTYTLDNDSKTALSGAHAGDTVTISYKLNAAGNVAPRAAIKIGDRKFVWTLADRNGQPSVDNGSYNIYTNVNGSNETTLTYTFTLADGGKATAVTAHIVSGSGTGWDVTTITDINDSLESLQVFSETRNNFDTAEITLSDFTATLTAAEYKNATAKFDSTNVAYYDEATGAVEEWKTGDAPYENGTIASRGVAFTITPNDDAIAGVKLENNNKSVTADSNGNEWTADTVITSGTVKIGAVVTSKDNSTLIYDKTGKGQWTLSIKSTEDGAYKSITIE